MTTTLKMTEAQLTSAVIELAEALHWRCIHFRPGLTRSGNWSTAMQGTWSNGFPDLLMIRGPRLLVAELKSDKGRIAPEQDAWLDAFREIGRGGGDVTCAVWYPRHWLNGVIEEELR